MFQRTGLCQGNSSQNGIKASQQPYKVELYAFSGANLSGGEVRMGSLSARIYRFGPFELSLEGAELRKNGIHLKLQEQPFRILCALLEHPGELVTREQLRQQLWAEGTFVDFEHGLNTAVKKIRDVLSDDADTPRYIETIPRRGYRFLASVEAGSAALAPPAEPESAPEPKCQELSPPRLIPGRTTLLAGVVAIALLAGVGGWLWRRTSSAANTKARVMLAVLPFDNLGPDASQDYFAEGMTEELITQLGRWNPERLGVIARTSTDPYKHAGKSVAQVGRELGVDYVVEGSARREGNKVRIAAQLIEVRDQTHLWAKQYDRDERSVLALQNDVAADVASEISVTLSPRTKISTQAVDPLAHEDFLKGQHYWNQLNCRGFEAALPAFESAVQRDAKFALAQAWLAATYYKLGDFKCKPGREMLRRAKEAALKAIQLDPELGKAHAVLGIVTSEQEWNWATAEQELELATRLDPDDAIGHTWYAAVSCEIGRQELCLTEMKRAHDLDPVALITNAVNAYLLYFLHRYDDALAGLNKTKELYPNSSAPYFLMAMMYERKGEYRKATDGYIKGRAIEGEPAAALDPYRMAVAREGWKGYWREGLRDELTRNSADHCALMEAYAHLGDKEQVLDLLESGYREHCGYMTALKADPLYDFVRAEPRFQAVLRQMGFPD